MVLTYRKEMTFKDAIDKYSHLWIEFHIEWAHYNVKFPQLQKICSTLASIFPNISTFEFDFSMIG